MTFVSKVAQAAITEREQVELDLSRRERAHRGLSDQEYQRLSGSNRKPALTDGTSGVFLTFEQAAHAFESFFDFQINMKKLIQAVGESREEMDKLAEDFKNSKWEK